MCFQCWLITNIFYTCVCVFVTKCVLNNCKVEKAKCQAALLVQVPSIETLLQSALAGNAYVVMVHSTHGSHSVP